MLYSGYDRSLTRDRRARDRAWNMEADLTELPAQAHAAMIKAIDMIATGFAESKPTRPFCWRSSRIPYRTGYGLHTCRTC